MMKPLSKLAFAGAVVIAAAGVTAAAAGEIRNMHVLTVSLPDGSQEQIRYVGDTPPQVRLQPGLAAVADPFGPASPFALMRQISAQMDREAAAMFQQAAVMPGPGFMRPDGLMQVDLGRLPPGVQGYEMVSTVTGSGVCTKTVRYTASDRGQPPKVLTSSSGACDGAPDRQGGPTAVGADRAPTSAPTLVQAQAPTKAAPPPALLHRINYAG
jgi:hypothetical protein